jgi:hypothetical protein
MFRNIVKLKATRREGIKLAPKTVRELFVKNDTKRRPTEVNNVMTEHQRSQRGNGPEKIVTGCESEVDFMEDPAKSGISRQWQPISEGGSRQS